jgi:hypothetical protein
MLKGLTESYPHLHIANFVFFMLLHNHVVHECNNFRVYKR